MPLIENVDIIGCYAQTELGHGSNVAGLETTATFDREKDEFVVHTPSITATKYWPGDMGMFSSHAVVFARLIIDENDYGVQPFMVQLRDTETWKVQPGIKCGDLGPKIGFTGKNNGWASFDQVRIPRTNMMMGLVNVSRDGEFSVSGDPRVLYSVMMAIRMQIIWGAGVLSLASTRIAIRYCSVRRQFSTQENSREERRVIDYQSCNFTLAKLLARSLVMTVVGNWIVGQYHAMMQEVKQKVFTRLDPNHHFLSGFKSLFTEQAMKVIDEGRRCAGGAGYQANAGFTAIWQQASPSVTLEGENNVMFGQATRYLVKLYRKVQKGEKLEFPFAYLNDLGQDLQSLRAEVTSAEDFLSVDLLEKMMGLRALNLIKTTMIDYDASQSPDRVKDNDLF